MSNETDNFCDLQKVIEETARDILKNLILKNTQIRKYMEMETLSYLLQPKTALCSEKKLK